MRPVNSKLIVVLSALLVLAPCAWSQQGEDFSGDRPGRPTAPVRASISGRGSGEVTIAVHSFGVGNVSRPGEWAGVWLEVKDASDKPRNVLLRLANPDIDGDSALMQRVIVTNPGSTQLVWLYLHVPFAAQDMLEIAAFEGVESGTAGGDQQQYTPGRMLGSYRYQVNQRQTAPIGIGLIGVVGGKTAGLDQYRWVADQRNEHAITGHELTELVPSLGLASLPDRWYGYSCFDALVWTSANSEDSPLNMREQQAEAIREYVKRGGHFIVILPQVGQNWVAQPSNPLADIIPAVKVARTEGVDAKEYRTLFTRDADAELPSSTVVQSFSPGRADNTWNAPDAVPIMVGPKQECVVVRRLVGTGMVTVIGIDIASDKFQSKSKSFMAEQFWNRILGKRMRTPTQLELSVAAKDGTLSNGTKPDVFDHAAQIQRIDTSVVAQAVNNEGSAATGLLLACVVFVGYWLVAGPVGYFVLKQRNWKQHAWVAFVCATGVFTAIAWGGANILKPRQVHGRHLTIIEGVYGQPNQRARSWMGLFLPRYGEQELSVAAPPGIGSGEWKNLIATLDSATTGGASYASFPDARGYVMDVRSPDTAAFPSRATTKQVQAEWSGVLPPNWVMPHPVISGDAAVPVGRELRVLERPNWQPPNPKWMIEGTLVHGLPQPLRNVTVLVVREPSSSGLDRQPEGLRRQMSRQQMAEWKPGDPLVLDTLFNKAGSEIGAVRDMFAGLAPTTQLNLGMSERDYADSMVGLATSFMDYAGPPAPNSGGRRNVVLQRSSTHGLDLSKWLTQPCVIVVGEIGADRAADGVECPIPVRVDGLAGDQVRTRVLGRTIVRWVFPLEASPFDAYSLAPAATSDAPAPTPGTTGGGGGGGTP